MYYYEGWLEVNAEKIKYKFMSCKQNAGQNHNIKTANKSLENEAKLKYLDITLNNKITCIKKLKADYIQGILAAILFRMCLCIC